MSGEITLYRALASRAFPVLWLLEELDLDYRSKIVSVADWRRPERLLEITPFGKVPAVVDGETVVTEAPAILPLPGRPLRLWRAVPEGRGAGPRALPEVDGLVDRGAGASARAAAHHRGPAEERLGVGWPAWDLVLKELADTVAHRQWLLGDRFSAADVMLGSVLSIGLFCEMIPPLPPLVAYNERLADRPANRRAGQLNWPPARFSPT